MNRDGQVWLDHNDYESVYIVISGPKRSTWGGWGNYTMLDAVRGTLCEWSEQPDWDNDRLLTRVA